MVKKLAQIFNRYLVPDISKKGKNNWWWIPFTYPFLFFFIVLFIVFSYLSYLTKKIGEVVVPDLHNKSINEVKDILKNAVLTYSIIDTVNVDSLPENSIVFQYPEPGLKVKNNRTIMLSISSHKNIPITMPDIIGLRLSDAIYTINAQNLGIKDTIWKQSTQPKYTVLEQRYKNVAIPAGKLLNKGSLLTLVVSSGEFLANEQEVPNIVGLSVDEAKMALMQYGLSIGIIHSEKNRMDEFIYRQNPSSGKDINGKPLSMKKNGSIEIWTSVHHK